MHKPNGDPMGSFFMKGQTVQPYSTVTVKSNNWQGKYTVVKPEEVDIFKNKISSHSPLGKALLGHKAKEVVKVQTPEGNKIYRILAIEEI